MELLKKVFVSNCGKFSTMALQCNGVHGYWRQRYRQRTATITVQVVPHPKIHKHVYDHNHCTNSCKLSVM